MTAGWDVIVVGARVAGASTALLLARAGLRVLCLERSRMGSDTVSTHALMRGGPLLLRRWGLLDAITAAGTPAVRRTVFHYGDEAVPLAIRPADGVDALYAPRRTLIDSVIAQAAMDAGAVIQFGCSVTGLLRDQHGRVIGVTTRRRDGSLRSERATLVVGADGRQSTVAAAVAAPVEAAGRASSAIVYGYWAGVAADSYDWFYRPGATAGVIPTNGGLACVFVGAAPGRMRQLIQDHRIQSAFSRLAAESSVDCVLPDARPVGGLRYVRGRPGWLRRSWGPGWALVGDAGSWKDPLSTHGMTDALRDAELLAMAVSAAPAPGLAQLRALAEYQDRRDAIARPLLATRDRVAAYGWDLTELRRLLLALAATMAKEVELIVSLPDAPWRR